MASILLFLFASVFALTFSLSLTHIISLSVSLTPANHHTPKADFFFFSFLLTPSYYNSLSTFHPTTHLLHLFI